MGSGGGADDRADDHAVDDWDEDDWDDGDSAGPEHGVPESAAARRARLRRGSGRRDSRLATAWQSRRVRIGVVAGFVLVVALGLVAWFSPVLSVRSVRIDGLAAVPEQQVLDALQVPDGLSMMRLDTTEMAQRVAHLPKVKSVRVQRSFPSSVKVTVEERSAVLYFDSPEGTHLLDCDSVEFAIEPPGPLAPKLVTDHPSGADPVTRAAVAVMASVPPGLLDQVGQVVARSVSDIALELRNGSTVLWGGSNDSQRKAAVVLPLLTQPGKVFDISSPNLVTVK
ncbi:FtsQ-type POTRA domain-containing protein [Nocardia sp. NPDC051030]|uniref:cell division protein FtsQ/DivIB n=1 Tax=Nocardia sp. NPDC051030 TaxID=3155162 RepID=UPI0034491DB3